LKIKGGKKYVLQESKEQREEAREVTAELASLFTQIK
jgi:hypothetical protein